MILPLYVSQYIIIAIFSVLFLILLFSLTIVSVPPNFCSIYFNSVTGKYLVYHAGLHWVGFSTLFLTPIKTVLQEKETSHITLTTYHDNITKYLILSASKLPIFIDCSAHIRITDPLCAVTTSKDIDATVDSICKSNLRNLFSTLSLDQIITTQSTLQKSLLSDINEDLTSYGVSCVGFTLTCVQIPESVQKSVIKITSEQLKQRCSMIEAQTNQKVHLKELQLKQLTHKANLDMAQLEHQSLMKKLHEFKNLDPRFSINDYLSSKLRSKAYSKCKSIVFYDGSIDTKRSNLPIQPESESEP